MKLLKIFMEMGSIKMSKILNAKIYKDVMREREV